MFVTLIGCQSDLQAHQWFAGRSGEYTFVFGLFAGSSGEFTFVFGLFVCAFWRAARQRRHETAAKRSGRTTAGRALQPASSAAKRAP